MHFPINITSVYFSHNNTFFIHLSPTVNTQIYFYFFFLWGYGPTQGGGFMATPFTRLLYHAHNDAPHSVALLWTSDQPVAEAHKWQHTTLTTDRHSCSSVGFEPTISAVDRPQNHTLEPQDSRLRDRHICSRGGNAVMRFQRIGNEILETGLQAANNPHYNQICQTTSLLKPCDQ